MQYVGEDSTVLGEIEMCPECDRPMLEWTFSSRVPDCKPSNGHAMCWGPR